MKSLTKQDGVIYGFTDTQLFAKDSVDYLWSVSYFEQTSKPVDIEVLGNIVFLKCRITGQVFEYCARTGVYTGNYTN